MLRTSSSSLRQSSSRKENWLSKISFGRFKFSWRKPNEDGIVTKVSNFFNDIWEHFLYSLECWDEEEFLSRTVQTDYSWDELPPADMQLVMQSVFRNLESVHPEPTIMSAKTVVADEQRYVNSFRFFRSNRVCPNVLVDNGASNGLRSRRAVDNDDDTVVDSSNHLRPAASLEE
eukprot:scaffold1884_cov343-Ochromonas_danica.AAC.36